MYQESMEPPNFVLPHNFAILMCIVVTELCVATKKCNINLKDGIRHILFPLDAGGVMRKI